MTAGEARSKQPGQPWLQFPGSKCRDRPQRRKLLGEEENLSLFMSCSRVELQEFGVRQSPALQSVLTPILFLGHLLQIRYIFSPKQ